MARLLRCPSLPELGGAGCDAWEAEGARARGRRERVGGGLGGRPPGARACARVPRTRGTVGAPAGGRGCARHRERLVWARARVLGWLGAGSVQGACARQAGGGVFVR